MAQQQEKRPSDFNDLAAARGMDLVMAQLQAALESHSARIPPVNQAPPPSAAASDFTAENAARLEWERRIEDADWEELIGRIVPEIQQAKMREATREKLLKLAARKAGISKQVMLDGWDGGKSTWDDGKPGAGDYEKLIDEINESHAILPMNGNVYVVNHEYDPSLDRPLLTFSSASAFELLYRNRKVFVDGEKVGLGTYWLDHPDRKQYKGLVFSPELEIQDYLNLWTGWGVNPHEGDCSKWLDFVHEIICNKDDELFGYLISYFAHMIQRPRELPETAVVFRGGEGTGKNTFFRAITSIVGNTHSIMLTSINQVAGRFSGHLADVLFVLCNESIWGGDKVHQGVLKSLISDEIQPIEDKGMKIKSIRNYKRTAFSTNENWAVPRGGDDRRFVIFDVQNTRKGDWDYWNAINMEMDNGGIEAIMFKLANLDLGDWQPRMIPNRLKENGYEIKIRSMGSVEQWWISVLQRGWLVKDRGNASDGWEMGMGESILCDVLIRDYVMWCQDWKIAHPEHPVVLGKLMKAFGVETSRPRAGNVGRKTFYKVPALDEAREICRQMYAFPADVWGADDGSEDE